MLLVELKSVSALGVGRLYPRWRGSTLICGNAQIQRPPDRRLLGGWFQLPGLRDFDDKRLCLLTHCSSKQRIAAQLYRGRLVSQADLVGDHASTVHIFPEARVGVGDR